MADTMRQVRNLILKLADEQSDVFRFKSSKKVNEAKFAEACGGVAPSTINRILKGQRNIVDEDERQRGTGPGEWEPGPALVAGLMHVGGYSTRGRLWREIADADEPRADDPSALLWGGDNYV